MILLAPLQGQSLIPISNHSARACTNTSATNKHLGFNQEIIQGGRVFSPLSLWTSGGRWRSCRGTTQNSHSNPETSGCKATLPAGRSTVTAQADKQMNPRQWRHWSLTWTYYNRTKTDLKYGTRAGKIRCLLLRISSFSFAFHQKIK